MSDRATWLDWLHRISGPVLDHAAKGQLKQAMPIYAKAGLEAERAKYSHLEALGRTLCGIAPWLELDTVDGEEAKLQTTLRKQARAAIDSATNPASSDRLNFSEGGQPVVDAAFLAHAILRAPTQLWQSLDAAVQNNLADSLAATRVITPYPNNWLLFSAMVEAALCKMNRPWDKIRVDYAVRQFEQWYLGDGVYGDGREFHHDYYNSFVIHPMLLDVLETVGGVTDQWKAFQPAAFKRATRYARSLELMIASDGSYPATGRSIAYRGGAFHLLAMMAWRKQLPEQIKPAQVRGALTAVQKRTLEPAGTFDINGWLQIGLAGHQLGLGETYISTGSLYLCTFCLLPLGLPASDAFWTDAAVDWTSRCIWAGCEDVVADSALKT